PSPRPASIRSRCGASARRSSPAYALPDELRVVASLPLLPSGKLDRVALQRTLST
ncbi:MAG: amino acid adenylation domain-containing protein, partial [Deltaproteobacteria bacterium]|nr:amino acid adenylation domain-containing protein [Deltaproteobacteria bacterium]